MQHSVVVALVTFLVFLPVHLCKVSSSSSSSSSSASNKTVTYPGLGTFEEVNFLDKSNALKNTSYLPISPSTINPSFLLYTRSNRANPQNISWNSTESAQRASHFNGTKLTKVIVHGYVENPQTREWMGEMKDAFLEKADVNVIIVDWSGGNKEPYGQAVANSALVGPMLALQISLLQRLKSATPQKFHLLCHSLGAHVCGYAGKFLNGTLRQVLLFLNVGYKGFFSLLKNSPQITGLDAARPLFKERQPGGRLWYSDAQFVDAIHTDGKPIVGMGLEEPYGTVDIYANGAKTQPGCAKERIGAFIDGGLSEGFVKRPVNRNLFS